MGVKWSMWDNSSQVYTKVGEASTSAMEECGKLLVEKIKDKMKNGYHEPHGKDGHTEIYDTGKLYNSVRYEVHPTKNHIATVTVGTDMSATNRSGKPYSIYVHEGTYKLHGRPFIRDATNENLQAVKDKIKGAYQNV